MKIVDRYLLRELAFPFIITVAGFMVIVQLNLILQLSGLLIDKGVSLGVLARLLFYRLPDLLVFSLPVATLFAIFLALGRLGHDRELVALQAGGFSLKRLIVPLLIAGLLVSGLTLLLEDSLAPWGTHQYWNLMRRLYLQRSVLLIQDNTFFKGPEQRFFYVRHYDAQRKLLEGVLIYDLSGTLAAPELGRAYPQVISAKEASWNGQIWLLRQGTIYAFDAAGKLVFHDSFQSMKINVGNDLRGLFLEQRTPQEMSLSELSARIAALRRNSLAAQSLVVTYQSKLAIPLAAFVFALFGAPLSLLFGPRGRALGIVLSFLLVNLYAGLLVWVELLGKRQVLPPALAPWLPNLVFTLVGLYLFMLVGRVSRSDLRQRLKRWLPSLLLLILSFASAWPAQAAPQTPSERLPLRLTAAKLIVQSGAQRIQAEGQVRAHYGVNQLRAQWLQLEEQPDGSWQLRARGGVEFSNGQLSAAAEQLSARLRFDANGRPIAQDIALSQSASLRYAVYAKVGARHGSPLQASPLLSARTLTLTSRPGSAGWLIQALGRVRFEQPSQKLIARAQTLSLRFQTEPGGALRAQSARLQRFSGASDFVNSQHKIYRLRYQGQEARLRFDAQNHIKQIDITQGEFTTCGCQAAIPQASYSLGAKSVSLYPDQLLVASGVTLRALGQPIFWMPFYLAPLGKLQRNPLIPQIGSSVARGWFVRWRLPFFAAADNYGALLLDYYSRYGEVGSGLDLNYSLSVGRGRLYWYRLVGRGEAFSLDWSHHWAGQIAKFPLQLDLAAALRAGALAQVKRPTKLLSQAALSGELAGVTWRAAWVRDQYLLGPQTNSKQAKQVPYRSLERLPELTLGRSGKLAQGLWSYRLSAAWGRYREQALDGSSRVSSRFDGALRVTLADLALFSSALHLKLDAGYRLTFYGLSERREAWEALPTLSLAPFSGFKASLAYSFRRVQGKTPFSFDRLTLANLLRGQAHWSVAGWGASLSGSYDYTGRRFAPAQLALSHQAGWSQTTLNWQYDLNLGRPITLGWSERLRWRRLALSLSGGYDFRLAHMQDLIAKLDFGRPLRVALDLNLERLRLERVNLQSALAWPGWQFSFGGEFSLVQGRLTAVQFGLVHHFCHDCWQIGLYGNGQQLQIQAQINAFPMAHLSYSPTDRRLAFGAQH